MAERLLCCWQSQTPPRQSTGVAHVVGDMPASGAQVMEERLRLARSGEGSELATHLDRTCDALGIDGTDAEASPERRSNALQAACWAGQAAVVSLLLRRGAGVDVVREHNGGSPLCIAAHAGHSDVVRLLARAGARLEQPNHNGATPAFIAAEHGREAALRALLLLGADANAPDAKGCTPCYIAAARGERGNTECVEALLDHGADPDVCNAEHTVPLHIAIGRGRLRSYEMLLDCGARTDLLAPIPRRSGFAAMEWTARQLVAAKFGLHANTREAFLEPLTVAEEVAPLVAAAQRLAWKQMGRGCGLTADLVRHVAQRLVPRRARLAVARRAARQWSGLDSAAQVLPGRDLPYSASGGALRPLAAAAAAGEARAAAAEEEEERPLAAAGGGDAAGGFGRAAKKRRTMPPGMPRCPVSQLLASDGGLLT